MVYGLLPQAETQISSRRVGIVAVVYSASWWLVVVDSRAIMKFAHRGPFADNGIDMPDLLSALCGTGPTLSVMNVEVSAQTV
jgi:hypothetical protein